jgi:hypothetical protein
MGAGDAVGRLRRDRAGSRAQSNRTAVAFRESVLHNAIVNVLVSRHLPASWHVPVRLHGVGWAAPPSTRFALFVHMKRLSSLVHDAADAVGRVFGRLAALIIGFILMVAGLGMTATVVMLPAGIVLGLLGVGMVVAGMFARDSA